MSSPLQVLVSTKRFWAWVAICEILFHRADNGMIYEHLELPQWSVQSHLQLWFSVFLMDIQMLDDNIFYTRIRKTAIVCFFFDVPGKDEKIHEYKIFFSVEAFCYFSHLMDCLYLHSLWARSVSLCVKLPSDLFGLMYARRQSSPQLLIKYRDIYCTALITPWNRCRL